MPHMTIRDPRSGVKYKLPVDRTPDSDAEAAAAAKRERRAARNAQRATDDGPPIVPDAVADARVRNMKRAARAAGRRETADIIGQ